jgi:four helix bundle protein
MEAKYSSNSHNFKALKIWQLAMELTSKVYLVSAGFPESERFGLTSQVRRCAVSIPSNIAEGCGRFSSKSFHHFLTIALGSLNELETQLLLAVKLNFVQKADSDPLIKEIESLQRMVVSMMRRTKSQDHTASEYEVSYETNQFSGQYRSIDLHLEPLSDTQFLTLIHSNIVEHPTQIPLKVQSSKSKV